MDIDFKGDNGESGIFKSFEKYLLGVCCGDDIAGDKAVETSGGVCSPGSDTRGEAENQRPGIKCQLAILRW